MVCAYCGSDTEVFNSRLQRRSNQVWRRRRCLKCQATFTTHETIHLSAAFLIKKASGEEPFTPGILQSEILACLREHPKAYEAAHSLSVTITQNVLKEAANGLILAHNISVEAAKVLKRFDKQAYWRFVAEHPSLQK